MTVTQSSVARDAPLPRHCPEPWAFDTIIYEGGGVTIGRFRCDRAHPSFRDTGPIRDAVVVFPRTSVWIRHEGSEPFVADPNVITIYDRGQRYERFAIAASGDHCDWIALDDALAREVASAHDEAAAESPDRPFRFERTAGSAELYARQRALRARAESERASAVEIESESMEIVSAVLGLAHGGSRGRPARTSRAASRRRGSRRGRARGAGAHRAREPLGARDRVHARRVAVSPVPGVPRAHWADDARLSRGDPASARDDEMGSRNLSAVAHEAGFASHAHLVAVCRREFGVTPSELRERLTAR